MHSIWKNPGKGNVKVTFPSDSSDEEEAEEEYHMIDESDKKGEESTESGFDVMCVECGKDCTIRCVIDSCGHNFCIECLQDWCSISEEAEGCPECQLIINNIAIDGVDRVYDFGEFKALKIEDLRAYENSELTPLGPQQEMFSFEEEEAEEEDNMMGPRNYTEMYSGSRSPPGKHQKVVIFSLDSSDEEDDHSIVWSDIEGEESDETESESVSGSTESDQSLSGSELTESDSDDMCNECGEDYTILCVVYPCGHQFCFECLHDMTEAAEKCPKCHFIINTIAIDGEDRVYNLGEFRALQIQALKAYENPEFGDFGPKRRPVYPEKGWNRWLLQMEPRNYTDMFDARRGRIGSDWRLKPGKDDTTPLHMDFMPFLVSPIIKNIKFIRKLGEGVFGSVQEIVATAYLGDKTYGPDISDRYPIWERRRFAMKVLQHEGDSGYDIKKSLREMHFMQLLRHENICNMFEIIGMRDRMTGFPYAVVCLIFELCDRDLNSLINKDLYSGEFEPSEEFTRHWFAQLAVAVAYLHSNRILHNDIHGRNIFVKYTETDIPEKERFRSSVVKLGDLGTAKYVHKYAENMFSKDIHSLGCVLQFLISVA